MDIEVVHEVKESMGEGDWSLCLQFVIYPHKTKTETGYRFIWRDQDGRLKPQMGQARILSLALAMRLMAQAMEAGWGNKLGQTTLPKVS